MGYRYMAPAIVASVHSTACFWILENELERLRKAAAYFSPELFISSLRMPWLAQKSPDRGKEGE